MLPQGPHVTYDTLLLKLAFPESLHRDAGAPASAEMLLRFPNVSEPVLEEVLEIELSVFNKTATRLGEVPSLP